MGSAHTWAWGGSEGEGGLDTPESEIPSLPKKVPKANFRI